jgi:VWFA-related protein
MKMKARRSAIAILATFLVAPLLCLAATNQNSDGQKASNVKINTRLVNVDVIVQDKQGNPVQGLTQSDFTIYDGGHKQKIDLFSAPTSEAPSKPPLQLPPDVYTNLLDAHGGVPPSVTIILLDGLSTTLTDQATAREQVLKYLAQIRPQDHVALYTLGSRLRILQDFTTDASSLLASLAKYQGSTANMQMQPPEVANLPPEAPAALNDLLQEMNRDNGAFYQERIIRMTIEAMDAIARHAQSLPGRKNLVWVSASFPICFCFSNPSYQQTDMERYFHDPIEQTAQLLADADVAVYPVDARGLFGVDLGFAPTVNGPGQVLSNAFPDTIVMQDVANWTGGRAFYNTNDIMGSIRKAVNDSSLSYVLGYYPDHGEWKGEFRKIKVKVDRPGLQVRTREGYFAIPELNEKPKTVEDELALIAASPLDATGIGFAVRITPINTDAAKQIQVTMHFDPHPIRFKPSKDNEDANIQYAVFELDSSGRILTGTDKEAKISVPQPDYERAMKEGMGFDLKLPLFTNAAELCVILRDNSTGRAGSVRIPLQKYGPQNPDKN